MQASQSTSRDDNAFYLDPSQIILPTEAMSVREWWDRFLPGCAEDLENVDSTMEGEAVALAEICVERGISFNLVGPDEMLAASIKFPWWLLFQYYSFAHGAS